MGVKYKKVRENYNPDFGEIWMTSNCYDIYDVYDYLVNQRDYIEDYMLQKAKASIEIKEFECTFGEMQAKGDENNDPYADMVFRCNTIDNKKDEHKCEIHFVKDLSKIFYNCDCEYCNSRHDKKICEHLVASMLYINENYEFNPENYILEVKMESVSEDNEIDILDSKINIKIVNDIEGLNRIIPKDICNKIMLFEKECRFLEQGVKCYDQKYTTWSDKKIREYFIKNNRDFNGFTNDILERSSDIFYYYFRESDYDFSKDSLNKIEEINDIEGRIENIESSVVFNPYTMETIHDFCRVIKTFRRVTKLKCDNHLFEAKYILIPQCLELFIVEASNVPKEFYENFNINGKKLSDGFCVQDDGKNMLIAFKLLDGTEDYLEDDIIDEDDGFSIKMPEDIQEKFANKVMELMGLDLEETIDDSENKEVLFSKEGFYYYIENDEVVITHGENAYDFKDKIVEIPSKINKLPVTRIGTNAFIDTVFNILICPSSIKRIDNSAFNNVDFNYLKLPKKLNYLDKKFVKVIMIDKNLPLKENEIKYPRIIQLPESVEEYTEETFINKMGVKFIATNRYKYLSKKEKESGSIFFIGKSVEIDENTNSLYTINDDKVDLIYYFDKKTSEEIPTEIKGHKVVSINADFLLNFTNYKVYFNDSNIKKLLLKKKTKDYIISYVEEVTEEIYDTYDLESKIKDKLLIEGYYLNILEQDDDSEESQQFVKLINNKFDDYIVIKRDDKIVIPNGITSIKNYHNGIVDIHDVCLVLPEDFKHIKNVKSDYYILLPKDCDCDFNKDEEDIIYLKKYHEEIDRFAEEKCFYYKEIKEDENGAKYAIIYDPYYEKEYAALLEINPQNNEFILNSYTKEGLPIKYLFNTKVNGDLKTFVFKNEFLLEESVYKNIKFKNKLDKFVIDSDSKTIYIDKYLNFRPDKCTKIEVAEGITDIDASKKYLFYIEYDEDDDSVEKLELFLPRSIKNIEDDSLKSGNIRKIYTYNKNVVNRNSYGSYCKVELIKDENINSTPKISTSTSTSTSAFVTSNTTSKAKMTNSPTSTNTNFSSAKIEPIKPNEKDVKPSQVLSKPSVSTNKPIFTEDYFSKPTTSQNYRVDNKDKKVIKNISIFAAIVLILILLIKLISNTVEKNKAELQRDLESWFGYKTSTTSDVISNVWVDKIYLPSYFSLSYKDKWYDVDITWNCEDTNISFQNKTIDYSSGSSIYTVFREKPYKYYCEMFVDKYYDTNKQYTITASYSFKNVTCSRDFYITIGTNTDRYVATHEKWSKKNDILYYNDKRYENNGNGSSTNHTYVGEYNINLKKYDFKYNHKLHIYGNYQNEYIETNVEFSYDIQTRMIVYEDQSFDAVSFLKKSDLILKEHWIDEYMDSIRELDDYFIYINQRENVSAWHDYNYK